MYAWTEPPVNTVKMDERKEVRMTNRKPQPSNLKIKTLRTHCVERGRGIPKEREEDKRRAVGECVLTFLFSPASRRERAVNKFQEFVCLFFWMEDKFLYALHSTNFRGTIEPKFC